MSPNTGKLAVPPTGTHGSVTLFVGRRSIEWRWFLCLPLRARPWSIYRPHVYRRAGHFMAFGSTFDWTVKRDAI